MREIKFEYLFFTEDKNFQRKIVLDLEDIEHGRFALEQLTTICDKSKTIRRQYTGLKDKNGKEIYESDILQVKWIKTYDDNDNPLYKYKNLEIKWDEEICGFSVEWEWYDSDYIRMALGYALQWLGDSNNEEFMDLEYNFNYNIYENPELLNERSK